MNPEANGLRGPARFSAMRVVAACLLLTAVLLAGCHGRPQSPPPGENLSASLLHDGHERTYHVHLPPQFDEGQPLPLLLMLHGGLGSGSQMQARYGMDERANQHGFIVAYPDGFSPTDNDQWRTWNATHCCGPAREGAIDDVGFLLALLDELTARYNIDTTRVGLAGHSNGAMMAYRLAAEASPRIASVQVVAGTIGGHATLDGPRETIPVPTTPVSVHIIHARDDPNVPYDGGDGTANVGVDRIDLSVADSTAFWVAANDLAGPTATAREGDVSLVTYGPVEGVEVRVVSTEGGHGWPGGPLLPLFAKRPNQPDATALVAAFLMEHPKPQ